MSIADIQNAISQSTALRTNPGYHSFMTIVHTSEPLVVAAMATNTSSVQYGNIRMAVGVWEQIAQIVGKLSAADRPQVFQCTPVSLMWKLLLPAIEKIRSAGADPSSPTASPGYAGNFEKLKDEYNAWTQTPAGKTYSTDAAQAVHAFFG
ncbi:MAG TPA: hypothetical protein VN702_21240 [Acetobacteraceae bacterium]|nr:hypothetical protein [Acetobacteraceae bacterium]